MKELALEGRSRLLAVSDISCDIEGSLEFLVRSTHIEKPFFVYRPETGEADDDIDGGGVRGVGVPCHAMPRIGGQHAYWNR
jgi:alpha-aminoadipic semialdehyde synthase